MSYRRKINGTVWHWSRNCSGWPRREFRQREDKPSMWGGQSLCEECDTGVLCTAITPRGVREAGAPSLSLRLHSIRMTSPRGAIGLAR